MPCRSDYLEANGFEIEASKVLCLLAELEGKKWTPEEWSGYHKKVYNKSVERKTLDKWTADLCKKLEGRNVKKFSLEMQFWWRDHQLADAAHKKQEKEEKEEEKTRKAALAKLSPKERRALGFK